MALALPMTAFISLAPQLLQAKAATGQLSRVVIKTHVTGLRRLFT